MTILYRSVENRDQLLKRVNCLEWQVLGVGGMIIEDRYCLEIVPQLSAAQVVAGALFLQTPEGHIGQCITDTVPCGEAEQEIHRRRL